MLAAALGACHHATTAAVRLDGSPRFPNDEGVATALSRTRIVLDGTRSYPVAKRFVSFSTYTGELQPLVSRLGQYVQIGVRDHEAVWLAGVAAVVTKPTPAVYYIGQLRYTRGDRVIFRDGTVLRVAPGLKVPRLGTTRRVTARIDPARRAVIQFVPG